VNSVHEGFAQRLFFPAAFALAHRFLAAAAIRALPVALIFRRFLGAASAFAALILAHRALTAMRATSERDNLFRPRRLIGAEEAPPLAIDSISP